MKWLKFENDAQLMTFEQALETLFAPFLEQLAEGGQPFFYFYWWKLLNASDCYLLLDGDDVIALATYPRIGDKHYLVWQSNTLVVNQQFAGEFQLPVDFDSEVYFTVPSFNDLSQSVFKIENCERESVQATYVKQLDSHVFQKSNSEVDYQIVSEMNRQQFEAIFLDVRKGDHPEADDVMLDYYIPLMQGHIRGSARSQMGWGFCAVENGEIIAGLWFSAWELPLTGTCCALVDDIVVKPGKRNRGIATDLQAFAYAQLKSEGLNWVAGNIDGGNGASVRQAEKIGRVPWALSQRIFR